MENAAENPVLAQYFANTNDCVQIKLLNNVEDLLRELLAAEMDDYLERAPTAVLPNGRCQVLSYKPEMTCQVFGSDERLFGYKNLRVTVFYSAGSLQLYAIAKCTSQLVEDVTVNEREIYEVDDVMRLLRTRLMTKQLTKNPVDYGRLLALERQFTPPGEHIDDFALESPQQSPATREFAVFKARADEPNFADYHERMQSFLLWANELASFVNLDNPAWEIFLVYEKLPITETEDSTLSQFQFSFAGFSAVYRYDVESNQVRPCVSQFLVLRPYQSTNLPATFLEAIYNHYTRKHTVEITFEEPSEFVQTTRDVLDCRLCQQLKSFSVDRLKLGWSPKMARDAKRVFKIGQSQSRRVFEILCLKSIVRHNNRLEYSRFRGLVQQRLNRKYRKKQARLGPSPTPEEPETNEGPSKQVARESTRPFIHVNTIRRLFEELELEYMRIISVL